MTLSPQTPASQLTVVDTARIMDKTWEEIQKKTFTKWVNTKLQMRGVAIQDLTADFLDGVALVHLLEIIGDESLGKFNKHPKLRIQKVENLNLCLNFIKRRGVNLTNIGAEDIVDGNEKLVLGMIWTVILRFTIADISEEGLTAKEGLLLWCQRKTSAYAPAVQVKEFTFSWQDGLAFCALIHHHRPDLLDFHKLDRSEKYKNMQLAFDVAQKDLGIPKLLDVEDVIDLPKPDERSVMTYVAQYFHTFSAMNKVGTAGRRVNNFVQVVQSLQEMQHDYEARTRKLQASLKDQQHTWEQTEFDGTYKDARASSNKFNKYKSNDKRTWIEEKRDLASLLSNIQTKIKTYHLAPYSSPAGCSLSDTDAAWKKHMDAEGEHKKRINSNIKNIRRSCQQNFADTANLVQEQLNVLTKNLGELSGELEEQMALVQTWQGTLPALEVKISECRAFEKECIDANVEDNELTIYSVEDLGFYFDSVKEGLTKKLAFIENQIVARNMNNVTPAQLEEFETTFRHFDKDLSNTLSPLEFKASLAGLGLSYEQEEFDKIFKQVSQDTSDVTFEQFVKYMRSITEDSTSPEQLAGAFKALADSKEFVTESDLRAAKMDESTIAYLKSVMPSNGNQGYNFAAYLEQFFKDS